MPHIELTPEEHETLSHFLEECLAELRAEISDTARHGFKDVLKQKKRIVMQILEKLKQPAEQAA